MIVYLASTSVSWSLLELQCSVSDIEGDGLQGAQGSESLTARDWVRGSSPGISNTVALITIISLWFVTCDSRLLCVVVVTAGGRTAAVPAGARRGHAEGENTGEETPRSGGRGRDKGQHQRRQISPNQTDGGK